jgi:hypothetical protein
MCFYKDQKRRRWLTVVYVLPVLCVVVFSLSACRADVPVEVAQSTLVATLDLSVRGEEDTATPSATFPFEPFEPSISETPLPPGRATRTFTPWPTSTPTIGPSPTRTRTSTLTRIPHPDPRAYADTDDHPHADGHLYPNAARTDHASSPTRDIV